MFVAAFIVCIRLLSLYYYTRVCYVSFSQSGVLRLMGRGLMLESWGLIIFMTFLIISLIFVPLGVEFL
jgi:hypothetical protein